MQLTEILDRHHVCDDDKARRVLNVSSAQANITADEIENGVTIERLSQLNVPVFRYATQVTIHGVIPDFRPDLRPAGYKSIFKNQNGSLGVKYVAIDAAKKSLIVRACHLAAKHDFHASLSSAGLELVFSTLDKAEAIAQFRSFPRDLIIGQVYAARGVFGDYFVVVEVGAILDSNVWPMIQFLYGFASQSELDTAQAEFDAAEKQRHEAWEKEYNQKQADTEARLAKEKVELLALLNSTHKPLARLPNGECNFVRLVKDLDEMKIKVYAIRKRGGSLCYGCRDYDDATKHGFEPTMKLHRINDFAVSRLNDAAKAGFLFEPLKK